MNTSQQWTSNRSELTSSLKELTFSRVFAVRLRDSVADDRFKVDAPADSDNCGLTVHDSSICFFLKTLVSYLTRPTVMQSWTSSAACPRKSTSRRLRSILSIPDFGRYLDDALIVFSRLDKHIEVAFV